MNELRIETSSHLFAAENGWAFPITWGEQLAHIRTSGFLNVNRDVKKFPDPLRLPHPWPDKERNEEVTPEERAAARAQLLRFSAFGPGE